MQVQQWPGAVSIFIRFLPDDIHINIHTVNEDGINSIPRVRAWYIAEVFTTPGMVLPRSGPLMLPTDFDSQSGNHIYRPRGSIAPHFCLCFPFVYACIPGTTVLCLPFSGVA